MRISRYTREPSLLIQVLCGPVVAIGSTNDLRLATAEWKRALIKHSDVQLYTRLNVSSSARDAEQADLASHYKLRSNRLPA